jgi:type I restriction enzyme S subunit
MSVQLQQTEIGEFPSAWEIDRVDSAFDIQQGKQVSSRNRDGEHQRPFLRTKNVFWNRLELTDLDQMHFSEAEQSRLELRANDLLVCEGGSIGRTALWNNEVEGCLHQNHLHRLRVKGERAYAQFGVYWLWYAFDVAKLYFGRGNVTTIPNLSQSKLAELPMALPPLPEQKKIAHILSTVRRAIEAQERIIQTTTELKKALMHKLFTVGLRHEPQKQTEIGPVPESWEIKRFDSFAVLQRGFDITKKDQRPGKYPVVSSGGISSYHDEAKVKGPGVVIGRKGSLGTVHYVASDYWPHDTTLWIKDFKGNNPRFVAYLLEKMRLKRFDTGAANPTLNRNIVHGEKVAIPPKDQQVEIGEALEAVESKITIHESRKRSFQDLFRTLLHELMTAKTRVHKLELPLPS